MIIVSFLKVVYPLKYPSNACLSYLDNGKECNLFRVSKFIGVLLSKAFFTCHRLTIIRCSLGLLKVGRLSVVHSNLSIVLCHTVVKYSY